MYNKTLIAERIATIQSSVRRLEELKRQYTLEEFAKNEDATDIAENRLRKALEALFDLGRHIVVKSGMGVPGDYRAITVKLSEGECSQRTSPDACSAWLDTKTASFTSTTKSFPRSSTLSLTNTLVIFLPS